MCIRDRYQAGIRWYGFAQPAGQGQVKHRRFIDDQGVDRQRVVGMVAEAAWVRGDTEQSVYRVRLAWQQRLQRGRQGAVTVAQRIKDARCGLAGRGGQCEA